MLIEPNSIIKLYKNVPLDNSYNNTLYFSSLHSQNEYFHNTSTILKRVFSNQSYQRVRRGVMRIEVKADDIYDCNYIAFQNTSYGTKWFYAFITAIEYISNTVSEVFFEIDVMQTWFFDVTLKESFVLREHSVVNAIETNYQSEPLNDLQYVIDNSVKHGFGSNFRCAIVATNVPYLKTADIPYENVRLIKGKFNNTYSGLYMLYSIRSADVVESIIKDFSTSESTSMSDIVTIFQYPAEFESIAGGASLYETHDYIQRPFTLDGYRPRNLKLLTYPFCYLKVRTSEGAEKNFRYEYFSDSNNIDFITTGTIYPACEGIVYPASYQHCSFQFSLPFSPSTDVGFSGDTYTEWQVFNKYTNAIKCFQIAQNSFSTILGNTQYNRSISTPTIQNSGNTLPSTQLSLDWEKTLSSGSKSSFSFNPTAYGLQLSQNFIDGLSIYNGFYQADKMASQLIGGAGSNIVNNAVGNVGVYFDKICIRQDLARIIDDYFDMFGYATNELKIPNRNSRPHWNYVKTNGCNIVGGAPSSDIAKIKAIYDNGITFWKHASEVGNYSLNNIPS